MGIREKGFRDLITGKDFLLCRTKNEYDVFRYCTSVLHEVKLLALLTLN